MLQAKRMATGCFTSGSGQHHRRAVDLGVRFHEAAFVRINDLEPVSGLAVAAGQPAAHMIEGQRGACRPRWSSP